MNPKFSMIGHQAFAWHGRAPGFGHRHISKPTGLFTWSEWVEVFSAEIADGGNPRIFKINWLTALEKLLNNSCIIGEKERRDRTDAWERACRARPW